MLNGLILITENTLLATVLISFGQIILHHSHVSTKKKNYFKRNFKFPSLAVHWFFFKYRCSLFRKSCFTAGRSCFLPPRNGGSCAVLSDGGCSRYLRTTPTCTFPFLAAADDSRRPHVTAALSLLPCISPPSRPLSRRRAHPPPIPPRPAPASSPAATALTVGAFCLQTK